MSLFNRLKSNFEFDDSSTIMDNKTWIPQKESFLYNAGIDPFVSKEQALQTLNMSDEDYKAFKEYKAMSPMQRVLSDLDYNDEFLTIAFATNVYRKENMKLDLAEFKTKAEHLEEVNKNLKKLEFMHSKQILIKIIYNLYYAYYNGVNGTKGDKLSRLNKPEIVPTTAPTDQPKPDAAPQKAPILTDDKPKGKNWKKNQKRRAKLKLKNQNA